MTNALNKASCRGVQQSGIPGRGRVEPSWWPHFGGSCTHCWLLDALAGDLTWVVFAIELASPMFELGTQWQRASLENTQAGYGSKLHQERTSKETKLCHDKVTSLVSLGSARVLCGFFSLLDGGVWSSPNFPPQDNGCFSEKQSQDLFLQLMTAVAYMHLCSQKVGRWLSFSMAGIWEIVVRSQKPPNHEEIPPRFFPMKFLIAEICFHLTSSFFTGKLNEKSVSYTS